MSKAFLSFLEVSEPRRTNVVDNTSTWEEKIQKTN